MAVGDNITALRFNALQTRIAAIMGSGSGQSGYGQTLTTGNSQVISGANITAASMNALLTDMQKARQHQTGTDQSASFPQVSTSTTITESAYTNLETQMTTIETNKFSIGGSGTAQSTTSTLSSSQRTTAWDTTLTHSLTIDFGSANAARYFFNAGGKINTRASLSGYSGTAGTDWYNLLTSMATISMDYTSTTTSGSGTTSTIGFYDLTSTNQQIFTKTGTTYTGNNYTVYARCDVASNTGGTARYVYIDVLFNDSDITNDSVINGTITNYIEVLTPTGSNVALTAPTSTVTANLSDAPIASTYTITPSTTSVNEGSTVTWTIATTDFGTGTLYWTNSGTTSSADFNDGTNSGSISITNNSGTLSKTLTNDQTTEGSETIIVQLRTGSTTGNIVKTSSTVTVNDTSLTPTYSITPPASINEGTAGTFAVTTTNFGSGTLYWTMYYTGSTATSADFAVQSGSVSITNNSGSFTITPTADATTEGAETFKVQLRTDSVSGSVVHTTGAVTVNDTSLNPTYSITPPASINEGSAGTFTVTTTDYGSGTLYWTINHTSTNASDFSAVSGSVSITNNSGSFTITPTADATTEGAETFTVSLRSGSVSGSVLYTTGAVTINDTSTTPATTYSITPPASINEGSAGTFTVTTTNFGSGTLYWTINHSTTDAADFSAVSGSVAITSNSGSFTITPTADATTEGAQTFTVSLRTGSVSGSVVHTTSAVTVNDTSVTPPYVPPPYVPPPYVPPPYVPPPYVPPPYVPPPYVPPPYVATPTYSISSAPSSINEGSAGTFYVTTTNFGSGTLYWTVNHSTTAAADFTTANRSGSVSITNNSGSFTIAPTADATTEGAQTFTVSLRTGSTSGTVVYTTGSITVNDTSVTPPYVPPPYVPPPYVPPPYVPPPYVPPPYVPPPYVPPPYVAPPGSITLYASQNWSVPAGVYSIRVTVKGGGGGGGTITPNGDCNDREGAGGGGSSGVLSSGTMSTTPGGYVSVSVGNGGAAGNNGMASSVSASGYVAAAGGLAGGGGPCCSYFINGDFKAGGASTGSGSSPGGNAFGQWVNTFMGYDAYSNPIYANILTYRGGYGGGTFGGAGGVAAGEGGYPGQQNGFNATDGTGCGGGGGAGIAGYGTGGAGSRGYVIIAWG